MPWSWLREFVDCGELPDVAEALTRRGVSVEAVHRPDPVCGLFAAVIECVEPHPRRPQSVCNLRIGSRSARVVSGAPGLRAGATVLWAAPGARLPHVSIETRDIGGVASEGMICAADEVGLPGGHEVVELAENDLPPGSELDADLAAVLHLDDPVLVLELTANYATHCQSILGVAREVAAMSGGSVRMPSGRPGGRADRPGQAVALDVREPSLCPRYVARVLEGPAGCSAPLWMRVRLQACGIRPILGAVDVTNFVMLELGQPLHAFDLDRLAGRAVQVRRAQAGERITTLDGVDRTLNSDDLVISDAAGAVAIAGVMGGQRTEVWTGTQSVLLESAAFAAATVAGTARRLGLPSEASSRFAHGVDPALAAVAADRAAALLIDGLAMRLQGSAEASVPLRPRAITMRGARARALLGVRLSTAACGRHLERFGFRVSADGPDRLRVAVPSWRLDVGEEVDLFEEIARSYGLDRLPTALPAGDPAPWEESPTAHAAGVVRALALGAGYTEAQPYSLHDRRLWDVLRLPPDHPWRAAPALDNPLSADQAVLRASLAGGLLRTLEFNARRRRGAAAVFEVGRVFRPRDTSLDAADAAARWADEPLAFGAAATGRLWPGTWQEAGPPADFFALKGVCEAVLERHGLAEAVQWRRGTDLPFLHPGRCASAVHGGEVIAWAGELHPSVREAFGLDAPASVAEVALDRCVQLMPARAALRVPPSHPPVRRDLAMLAPADLPEADLAAALRQAGAPLLQELRLFDVYRGEGVPEGRASLAFALTYQDPARTLTDAEVDRVHDAVRESVVRRFGVVPRS